MLTIKWLQVLAGFHLLITYLLSPCERHKRTECLHLCFGEGGFDILSCFNSSLSFILVLNSNPEAWPMTKRCLKQCPHVLSLWKAFLAPSPTLPICQPSHLSGLCHVHAAPSCLKKWQAYYLTYCQLCPGHNRWQVDCDCFISCASLLETLCLSKGIVFLLMRLEYRTWRISTVCPMHCTWSNEVHSAIGACYSG